MANPDRLNRIKRRLQDSWIEATEEIRRQTAEITERVRPESGQPLTERKIESIVEKAIEVEAEERAEAVTSTIVNELLETIEGLEGKVTNLEERVARLEGLLSFSITTT